MTWVVREGDDAFFHGWSPLTHPVFCSQNVLTNGTPTARIGDIYDPPTHCVPLVCHPVGRAMQGSGDVLVNGMGIHRVNDLITCGARAGFVSSKDVFAND